MAQHQPTLASLKPRLAHGRTVVLDTLTAAAHPDAVVSGVLLAVVGLLVAVGLVGLVGPVVSLDLFSPDIGFSDLLQYLAQIMVATTALIAAGLGLARHPRFPALFMAVVAGLTVLITFALTVRLLGGMPPWAGLPPFTLLGLPLILAVPYVVFSRRCRLIFRRRLNVNDLKTLADPKPWSQPPSTLPVLGTALPGARDGASGPAPRRQRTHRTGPATKAGGQPGSANNPPAPDAPNAALWAALYGTSAESATGTNEPADAGGGSQGGAGKRVGLEALINLRPPGS